MVKLLGSLVPEEPRLARKLLDPLCGIVKSTHAKSLLYEANFAITLCLPYVKKANGAQPSNLPEVRAIMSIPFFLFHWSPNCSSLFYWLLFY